MAQARDGGELSEKLIRHYVLNIIRSSRTKYRQECGEIVICCDSPDLWRKDLFPHYKANRYKKKKDSLVDWTLLRQITAQIADELEEYFPYKYVKVPKAEADDIIATICLTEPGPHMIITNDKDFFQLPAKIYSPVKKAVVFSDRPADYLREHIILGDEGDGIPNIRSDDDTFVAAKKRQKVIRKEKVQEWLQAPDIKAVLTEEEWANFQRNERLISLYAIPEEIRETIWKAYIEKEVVGQRGMPLLRYFMSHNLKNMVDRINEF